MKKFIPLIMLMTLQYQAISQSCYSFNNPTFSFPVSGYGTFQPWMKFNNNFTITAWVKRTSLATENAIFSFLSSGGADSILIMVDHTNKLIGQLGKSINLNYAYPSDTNWHNVALSNNYTRNKSYLCLDGTIVDSTNGISWNLSDSTPNINLTIGYQQANSSVTSIANKWSGDITQFWIYGAAISSNFTPDCSPTVFSVPSIYLWLELNDADNFAVKYNNVFTYLTNPSGSMVHTSPCSPVLSYSFNKSITTCASDSVTIYVHNSNPFSKNTGGWNKHTEPAGLYNDSVVIRSTGSYYMASDCQTDTFNIKICTDAVTDINKASITVSPNPTSNSIYISSPVVINDLEIINLVGQTVLSVKPAKSNVITDLSELRKGIYILKVNNQYIKKIEKN